MSKMSEKSNVPKGLDSSSSKSPVFNDVVKARKSVRDFLPDTVPQEVLEKVLQSAQLTPSNANTHPWMVHIGSGNAKENWSFDLLTAVGGGQVSLDFSFSIEEYSGPCHARAQRHGEISNAEEGIARDDKEARMAKAMKNYSFFGAPHVALLFLPSVGDNVRAAADIGMYGQTFLLSLVANGLAGVPQTSIGMFANTVRESIGVSDDLKLLFAISFGYPSPTELNKPVMEKADLSETIVFHT